MGRRSGAPQTPSSVEHMTHTRVSSHSFASHHRSGQAPGTPSDSRLSRTAPPRTSCPGRASPRRDDATAAPRNTSMTAQASPFQAATMCANILVNVFQTIAILGMMTVAWPQIFQATTERFQAASFLFHDSFPLRATNERDERARLERRTGSRKIDRASAGHRVLLVFSGGPLKGSNRARVFFRFGVPGVPGSSCNVCSLSGPKRTAPGQRRS